MQMSDPWLFGNMPPPTVVPTRHETALRPAMLTNEAETTVPTTYPFAVKVKVPPRGAWLGLIEELDWTEKVADPVYPPTSESEATIVWDPYGTAGIVTEQLMAPALLAVQLELALCPSSVKVTAAYAV